MKKKHTISYLPKPDRYFLREQTDSYFWNHSINKNSSFNKIYYNDALLFSS